jgi:hypothetical protein
MVNAGQHSNRKTHSEGSIAMTPVTSSASCSASWVGRLSVATAFVAFAFVGAIVLGFF